MTLNASCPLDTVSCLALLDIHKAQPIQCVESDLFYLNVPGIEAQIKPTCRYVFFCTSSTWSELICNKLFQERFDAALHFSLVQKGVLGAIRIADIEVLVITDAFAAPPNKLDLPNGFYLFEVPIGNLHDLRAFKLHTDAV